MPSRLCSIRIRLASLLGRTLEPGPGITRSVGESCARDCRWFSLKLARARPSRDHMVALLKEEEAGLTALARIHVVSRNTIYNWRKKSLSSVLTIGVIRATADDWRYPWFLVFVCHRPA